MSEDSVASDPRSDVPGDVENFTNPLHYTKFCIQPIEAIYNWRLGFNLGNAVKYLARAGHKGLRYQDLEKAIWYIRREIYENASDAAETTETTETTASSTVGRDLKTGESPQPYFQD